MRYPEVIHRQLWITRPPGPFFNACRACFQLRQALVTVQTAGRPTRTLKTDGTKIASFFLQAQLLLFSQNHLGNG